MGCFNVTNLFHLSINVSAFCFGYPYHIWLSFIVMIDCANPITGILGVLEQSRAEGYEHIDPHYIGRDLPTSRRRWRRCWASGMVRDNNPQNSGE